ncbi:glycosyltransferase family 2 protein [Jannaschia sp. S6380]|uniref:glycosyltransferase family 2 protein n=1 Tax=Jannaschia sp. S6380 TaxID=2926408 RepID=UPI001FF491B0|nr:glycosyltransferase family 2 protein [Jannaschia sp. S6380]MCK0166326.1 glycosyltransferase family 2 protein [Jannaschia sp. S6380]
MSVKPAITVVTCMRNEGPFVVEWLAHLRRLGVQRVLVYTNDCRDGTEDLLDALSSEGVIHVRQGRALGDSDEGRTPQWRAMAAAWDHPVCAGADWLLHIDPDEYIAIDGGHDLPAFLARTPEAQAIALPWRLFGCNGRLNAGSGTTPERFPLAAPPGVAYPALASYFKTLFRRDGPFDGFGIHRPRQTSAPVFLDDCGRRDDDLARAARRILLWRAGNPPDGRQVQLNHYSTRSVHEFLVKRERGLPNHVGKAIDLEYWVERNFNQVACRMFTPQLPAMTDEITCLRVHPAVAAAEERCRAWHRAELARILATPEGARFCGRLALAATSQAPDPALGRALVAQTRKAQATR